MKNHEMKALQDIATIRPGASGSIFDREPTTGSHSVMLLKGMSMNADGAIDLSNADTVWIKPDRDATRFILKAGDVLLMARGSGVRAGLIGSEARKHTLLPSPNFMIIRPKNPEKISGAVIAAYLNSSLGKAALDAISNGSVIQSIPASGLRNLEVPVPDRSNQARIVELIQASKDAHQATLELAAQQQKAAQAKILDLMYQ